MKKVLLVTDGIFHPPLFGRMTLHRVFHQMDGFSFQHIRSLEQLPMDMEKFSALVLHYHHKTISPSVLARLEWFIKNGGGILAIHAATASFKQSMPYFKILGGQFTGHGKVENFEVIKVRDDIFTGISNFFIKDELYIHELEPGIEVHFTTKYQGKDVPVVWTYHYGRGSVCYTVPGHTTATMSHPMYQKILQRGLEWVTG